HEVDGSLDYAPQSVVADEHVVRFLVEHEPGAARERVECGLRHRKQLELAVAVGQKTPHEVRQPVLQRVVECVEDTRIVYRARTTREQPLRVVASVGAEML